MNDHQTRTLDGAAGFERTRADREIGVEAWEIDREFVCPMCCRTFFQLEDGAYCPHCEADLT